MTCDIRIGTSGFHYQHWKGPFYPAKTPNSKLLDYYVGRFDTVELNNRSYRLPTTEAFDGWRGSTPDNFLFAVKASRFITHNQNLKDPENALNNLLVPGPPLPKGRGPVFGRSQRRESEQRLVQHLGVAHRVAVAPP
jgi:uncharacterized protein YecE (DUF72 family)